LPWLAAKLGELRVGKNARPAVRNLFDLVGVEQEPDRIGPGA
jgi:hypothetical protein